MMSSGSNFLSRWSRLKREDADRRGNSPAEKPAENNSLAPAELPAEELARLPRIEDFTPETDLTPFLRNGIPAALRNAALRRMWTLDPAIRDSVSDALDYAYDWNVAGGVPGSGPLLPSDDVEAMVRSIMSGPVAEPRNEAQAEGVSTPVAPASSDEAEVSSALRVEDPPAPAVAGAAPATNDRLVGPQAGGMAESAKPAASKKAAEAVVAERPRHGGATPF
jgi:hypothetical protein